MPHRAAPPTCAGPRPQVHTRPACPRVDSALLLRGTSGRTRGQARMRPGVNGLPPGHRPFRAALGTDVQRRGQACGEWVATHLAPNADRVAEGFQLGEQCRFATLVRGWGRMQRVGATLENVRRRGPWSRLGCRSWAVSFWAHQLAARRRRAWADLRASRVKYALRANSARLMRSAGASLLSGSTSCSNLASIARRPGSVRAVRSSVFAQDS